MTETKRHPHADNYGLFGYALAMRVLQSGLYPKLDDRERAECDGLIRAGQAVSKPEPKPDVVLFVNAYDDPRWSAGWRTEDSARRNAAKDCIGIIRYVVRDGALKDAEVLK